VLGQLGRFPSNPEPCKVIRPLLGKPFCASLSVRAQLFARLCGLSYLGTDLYEDPARLVLFGGDVDLVAFFLEGWHWEGQGGPGRLEGPTAFRIGTRDLWYGQLTISRAGGEERARKSGDPRR